MHPRGNEPKRRRTSGWTPSKGDSVELRRWGRTLRLGVVETAIPDGSGFWIEPNGAEPRLFVHFSFTDIEIWA
ncbi:hypothetical protein [Sinomonas sp.]|uniref:hypothetical protein n=1 Tax=Sinomonas sp. TaxID=1914986 RepID=UPI002FE3D7D2